MQCRVTWAFFFQAEDGIRYLVRSRGLGDVYKRQELKADLMITQELRDRMPDADKRFTFGDLELLRVKGGKRQMGVRTVARKVVAATLQ